MNVNVVRSLDDEQRKLLNDHDLQLLIEQNVELRHQETFLVSLIGVAVGLFLALWGAASHPAREALQQATTDHAYFAVWVRTLGDKFFDGVILIAGFIFVVSLAVKLNVRAAEKRILAAYDSLAVRNDIPPNSFIRIHEFPEYSFVGKKRRRIASAPRDFLSTFGMVGSFFLIVMSFLIVIRYFPN